MRRGTATTILHGVVLRDDQDRAGDDNLLDNRRGSSRTRRIRQLLQGHPPTFVNRLLVAHQLRTGPPSLKAVWKIQFVRFGFWYRIYRDQFMNGRRVGMDAGYPSDLTDEEWGILQPKILKRKTIRGRPREVPFRQIFSGIFYLNKEGCQ